MTSKISNWGRWGPDDQLGMLNLMTPDRVLAALGLVKRDRVYNLFVPLEKDGPQHPTFPKTWRVTHYRDYASPEGTGVADDTVVLESHAGTHIDALGHYWAGGKMWNGRSVSEVSSAGVGWGAIHNLSALIGRGVMLDIAAHKGVDNLQKGEVVTVEDMETCAASQGVQVLAGDILLLHTGWQRVFYRDRAQWDQGYPGPDESCAQWLKDRDIVALGADNPGVEAKSGFTSAGSPLHIITLRDLGVYLIENVNLEELARDKVYEFLFVAAPLNLTHATGAPTSPLAIV